MDRDSGRGVDVRTGENDVSGGGGDRGVRIDPSVPPPAGDQLYQRYEREEETVRSSFHYEKDPEFFNTLTGGEWNVYSCLLWENGFSVTQAQERKLDLLAELLGLKPGMRVLDVGCGWGGPLVYLCHRYGVTGHGITITPGQLPDARSRAARYGVDAAFEVLHWRDLPEVECYDAIYSDEVLVHFPDLGAFFSKCHKVLKPGGLMAHKELHLTSSHYRELGPLGRHINKVYGFTGNYLPLHRELQILDDNGFRLEHVVEIPLEQYHLTMQAWLLHLADNRGRMIDLVGPTVYRDFCVYLRGYRRLFSRGYLRIDVVASRKRD
jgi:cyclopropane-fatty-acyl-phospholipid synthase